jgi:hypothetical protein
LDVLPGRWQALISVVAPLTSSKDKVVASMNGVFAISKAAMTMTEVRIETSRVD